jgi:hypothetical protein
VARVTPWGRGTSPGPDFEDLIRRGQDRLKQFMPSGSPRGAIVLGGREIELGQKASAPLASFIYLFLLVAVSAFSSPWPLNMTVLRESGPRRRLPEQSSRLSNMTALPG